MLSLLSLSGLMTLPITKIKKLKISFYLKNHFYNMLSGTSVQNDLKE